MKSSSSLTLLFLALVSLLSALPSRSFPLRGQLAPGDHLEDLSLLGPSVRVHLNRVPTQQLQLASSTSPLPSPSSSEPHEQVDQASTSTPANELTPSLPQWNQTRHSYSTLIKRDGSFTFPELEAGTYLLTLAARTHAFHQYRIDVPLVGEMAGWGQHKRQKTVTARTWLP